MVPGPAAHCCTGIQVCVQKRVHWEPVNHFTLQQAVAEMPGGQPWILTLNRGRFADVTLFGAAQQFISVEACCTFLHRDAEV